MVKNLLPTYQNLLQTQYLPSFQSLIATANKIEDLIQTGHIKEDSSKYKKPGQAQNKPKEISNINSVNPFHLSNVNSGKETKSRRQYTNLGMPIEKVFQAAVKENYMKPLSSQSPASELPRK